MSVLINFEDRYGVSDIVCKSLLGYTIPDEMVIYKNGNTTIRRALCSSVLDPGRRKTTEAEKIIFVYDMDNIGIQENNVLILSKEELEKRINRLKNFYSESELFFVPVIFSAETICLHMLKSSETDFSKVFSNVNTASLHTRIMTDILKEIYYKDKNIKEFYPKRTRDHINLMNDINVVIKYLVELNFSEFNNTLFKWIESGNIEDTSNMLNCERAIELQENFCEEYYKFLEKKFSKVEILNKMYDLNKVYRERGKIKIKRT